MYNIKVFFFQIKISELVQVGGEWSIIMTTTWTIFYSNSQIQMAVFILLTSLESVSSTSIKLGNLIILFPTTPTPTPRLGWSLLSISPIYKINIAPQIWVNMGKGIAFVINSYIKPHRVWSKDDVTVNQTCILLNLCRPIMVIYVFS